METKDLKKLAKAELHCHLDGSLSLDTIRQLAALAQVDVPQDDSELKQLVTAPETCESLMDYLKTFDVIRPLLQTPQALTLAAYDVVKQAALENVIYIEIRFAPELSMDQGLTATQVVEAVLKGLEQGQKEFGIVAKAIVCGMRQSSLDISREIFANVLEWANKGLVGFDFAGNELDFPPAVLADLIKETQAYGLPFTLHAGECGCPNYVVDAIDLGIKRLGHVTAIHNQKDLLAKFIANDVTAELCFTSNLQTKAARTVEDFPYMQLRQAGAKLSINTDNRTVSDTNLTKEYELFVKHFETSVTDFLEHNRDAIKASFASPAEKEALLDRLEKAYQSYIKK
ncbi:TPA: adenosine deaminase [Streptococcus equi subsp. zooepidemicus]|nr:adenosine deaminase [Streptococcus equi subsp. zooepidemicus]HEL0045136.1 adenosine deaminase [Streptococcus equi subsp. zooepidemicus]HEL0130002.1 adenosine deaminase [Streptococcus equi subsp. zooepidemicus]HEL0151793.1 adenosine deaminase [Streptococcus equi subsp. zooepidemicus]HEL0242013.1 adenosine deaminase [Streptococcus equi subsp. zooepidemicus]